MIFFRIKNYFNHNLHNLSIITYLMIIVTCLWSNYLWFDEAGQYYISKGLNHKVPPFVPNGNMSEMILNNNLFNLDPGGFSLLLRLFITICDTLWFIRLLPLSFFILCLYFFRKSLIINGLNSKVSTIITLFLFLIPNFFSKSIELRAYSMEMLLTVSCVYFLIEITKAKKIRAARLIQMSIMIGLTMTSRYSAIITAICFTAVMISHLITDNISWSKKIKNIVYISSVPFIIGILIYIISLKNQNPDLNSVSYSNYLKNNPWSLFQFSNILFFTILICTSYFGYKRDKKVLINYLLIINFIFMTLSFMGVYPWDLNDPRSNQILMTLFLLTVVVFKTELTQIFQSTNKLIVLSFLVAPIFFFSLKYSLKDNWRQKNEVFEINGFLSKSKNNQNKVFIVDYEFYPSVKFALEKKILIKPINISLNDSTNYRLKESADFVYVTTKSNNGLLPMTGFRFLKISN